MILAIVSVLAVALFAAEELLTLVRQEYGNGSEDRRQYAEDMAYLLWGEETGALYMDQGGYGNVSLQQEGEAWRSTLCHGPDDCSN
jgi:hypothetical protein